MKYKGTDYATAFALMKRRKEEVIEDLRKHENALGGVSDRAEVELLDIVLSALRKRLPAKPTGAEGYFGKCQQCKTRFDRQYKYCPGCGQKVEWGSTK